MATQEAAAAAAGQPSPFASSSLLSAPPPGPLLETGKVSRHKRKEKKNRTKALLRRVKEAASSSPSTSSAQPEDQHGVQLLNTAGSQVVPPLRRPIPVTPLSATIDRVIEIYRGQVRALWKSQRPYGRNTELSA